jgi:protein ImuA
LATALTVASCTRLQQKNIHQRDRVGSFTSEARRLIENCIYVQYYRCMPSLALSVPVTTHVQDLLQRQQVWRADACASTSSSTWSTGFEALDAALTGGGWPQSALIEVLRTSSASGDWSLILPGLRARLQGNSDCAVLVNPPHEPGLLSLAQAGVPVQRLLRINTTEPPSRQASMHQLACWATEQALHCADVGVVLAWLPQVHDQSLRRLQVAAAQSNALVFVFTLPHRLQTSSPAPIRLELSLWSDGGPAKAMVRLFKQRGLGHEAQVPIDLYTAPIRALLQAPKRHVPVIATTTPQHASITRLTPRSPSDSQITGFGNERAADGSARTPMVPHGLDRPPRSTSPPLIHITDSLPADAATGRSDTHERLHALPARQLVRAARHARSH